MRHIFTALVIGAISFSSQGRADEVATQRTMAADVAWGATPFGPEAASVYGNFTEGTHVTLIRFPAGLTTPVHTHSHGYSGIVVAGRSRHFEPGKPDSKTILGAGSHWSIPGDLPHVSECLEGAECVFAIFQADPFDFIPKEQSE